MRVVSNSDTIISSGVECDLAWACAPGVVLVGAVEEGPAAGWLTAFEVAMELVNDNVCLCRSDILPGGLRRYVFMLMLVQVCGGEEKVSVCMSVDNKFGGGLVVAVEENGYIGGCRCVFRGMCRHRWS